MAQAKSGDKVKVHYTGKFADGTVFDSTSDRPPLEFTLGSGQVIPGFEEAVSGMETGESKTVTICEGQAYGPRYDELVLKAERNQLPENIDPRVGQRLQSQQEDGRVLIFTVTEVTDDNVTLDANHPLAGKELTFDIELLEIA